MAALRVTLRGGGCKRLPLGLPTLKWLLRTPDALTRHRPGSVRNLTWLRVATSSDALVSQSRAHARSCAGSSASSRACCNRWRPIRPQPPLES